MRRFPPFLFTDPSYTFSQIHFFAHLTVAGLISPDSMFALLQSFTAVLDEFGVSYGRAKKAALCAAEGLMIGGPVLHQNSPTSALEIINAIQAFSETTVNAKWLVQPTVGFYSGVTNTLDNADEVRLFFVFPRSRI